MEGVENIVGRSVCGEMEVIGTLEGSSVRCFNIRFFFKKEY